MKPKLLSWSCVAFFATGLAVGALAGCLVFTHYAKKHLLVGEAAHVISTVHMLEQLNAHKTNKLGEFLERKLSGHLVWFYREDLNKNGYDQVIVRAVKNAKKYRSSHSFKSGDAEMDELVQSVLDKVED
jgi:hypothetical protein